ncbi:MAG TPA: UDP-N-acetylglucosamine--N-acetylmuramyl-(pentapeptide) pyrophosphoryl-undecaprenol N-acetylglucosamine transferase [Phycisphaerales bacterium]
MSEHRLQVIFAGGGTGGHLYPAIAIHEQLADASDRVDSHFICSTRPLDAKLLTEEGVDFTPVAARPFALRPLPLAQFVRTWPAVVRHCRRVIEQLRERGPVVMVAMGGFVSAPAAAAARKARVPLVLVNLDATPGKANRWVAKRSRVVFTAAEPEGHAFSHWQRIRPIVRWAAIADGDRAFCRRELGLDPDKPLLLVTGASQGARSINALMVRMLETQPSRFLGWQVIHQCGPANLGGGGAIDEHAITAAYAKAGVPAMVRPLFREMGRVWGAADVALSRCGAGSVAEAWANRVPSIFLPYPFHKDEHQRKNAIPLERAGGAIIVKDHVDAAANQDSAGAALLDLLAEPEKRDAMREKLRELGPPDGAGAVARAILAMK